MTRADGRRHTLEDLRFLHAILALPDSHKGENTMPLDEVDHLIQGLQLIDPRSINIETVNICHQDLIRLEQCILESPQPLTGPIQAQLLKLSPLLLHLLRFSLPNTVPIALRLLALMCECGYVPEETLFTEVIIPHLHLFPNHLVQNPKIAEALLLFLLACSEIVAYNRQILLLFLEPRLLSDSVCAFIDPELRWQDSLPPDLTAHRLFLLVASVCACFFYNCASDDTEAIQLLQPTVTIYTTLAETFSSSPTLWLDVRERLLEAIAYALDLDGVLEILAEISFWKAGLDALSIPQLTPIALKILTDIMQTNSSLPLLEALDSDLFLEQLSETLRGNNAQAWHCAGLIINVLILNSRTALARIRASPLPEQAVEGISSTSSSVAHSAINLVGILMESCWIEMYEAGVIPALEEYLVKALQSIKSIQHAFIRKSLMALTQLLQQSVISPCYDAIVDALTSDRLLECYENAKDLPNTAIYSLARGLEQLRRADL
ncbi:hypothetical protein GMRT_14859 [Giardia muris]|uniref:Uncharacterized protein n=1 Tax=Giardia muris TaxID=5742 RepID=A0A4Z1SKR2_GIAMU|nr:hypothetical protein GMRT_14859 [Giardia muris]|eukprot:TNJ26236.1 hypothetical protein GMRT_14859 [Giardia muris]